MSSAHRRACVSDVSGRDSLKKVFEQANKTAPEFDFVAADGIRHVLTAISDPELIGRFKEAFKGVELYIADGHHGRPRQLR
jgi:uncharacterized protein (DUF1015 family)